MISPELDNPIWASLNSRHRRLARCAGEAARYSPEVAPFFGVASATTELADDIAAMLETDETVYLLGTAPSVSAAWSLKAFPPLAQMICNAPIAAIEGPEIVELSDSHRAAVLELTALVYPHYFRPHTMDLGRYFGIYQQGRLAAMIGERLGTDAFQEMSAICTHPDFIGRGYARRLTAMLSNYTLEHGRTPFLHVSHANQRAVRLYEQIGYHHRSDIGFWSLRRT
ncbi:MAG: GNAT family N-acetyltransferase [Pseudomarimonas sp.]